MWLEEAVLRPPLELGAIQSIRIQVRGMETGMGAEKGGETDQGTSLSWHKATTAWLVYSAKVKGERLSPYHLCKKIKS